MLYRLVRPMRREGSRNCYFNQRIPLDVLAQVRGMGKLDVPCGEDTVRVTIRERTTHIKFSLGTSDPSEVKQRQAAVAAHLESVWQALRDDAPIALTHEDAVALAGELYRARISGAGRERVTKIVYDAEGNDDPEGGDDSEELVAELDAAVKTVARLRGGLRLSTGDPVWANADDIKAGHARDLEAALGGIVDRLLLAKGIKRVDQHTRMMLLEECQRAEHQALEHLRRQRAEGDYSPDPRAGRFPGPVAATVEPEPEPNGKDTVSGLFEAWRAEAEKTDKAHNTIKNYGGVVKRFVAFLGHDDARRVTPPNVVAFKDWRLEQDINPKTIKDVDLVALKAIFGWAYQNHHLPSNPAAGIPLKLGRRSGTRDKGFTDDEAAAILKHAMEHRGSKREAAETAAAKRWVPWLCAYTGARIGEIVQLRRQDVRKDGEHWIITIDPKAGTVKTGKKREVPLHEHVIALGFGKFVEKARDGYLFFTPSKGGWRGPHRSVCKKLAVFAREVVPDEEVAPNHGWRHLFKTRGREAGIDGDVLDAICGHEPGNVGARYGVVTLATRIAAIGKLPRFDVA
jgi:integrase